MTQVLELGDVKSELIIKRQELFKMEHEEKEAGDKLKALIETQNNASHESHISRGTSLFFFPS
jgi:hypothetical protein